MDLISREEVRRILAFYIYELVIDALTVDEFRTKIRECIDTIPSQNKWISVKERLPEEGTECLVTVLHREPYSFKYEYKVTEAYYAEYWGYLTMIIVVHGF